MKNQQVLMGSKQNSIDTSRKNCTPICYNVLILPMVAENYRSLKDGEL